jgi:hypothetical protein
MTALEEALIISRRVILCRALRASSGEGTVVKGGRSRFGQSDGCNVPWCRSTYPARARRAKALTNTRLQTSQEGREILTQPRLVSTSPDTPRLKAREPPLPSAESTPGLFPAQVGKMGKGPAYRRLQVALSRNNVTRSDHMRLLAVPGVTLGRSSCRSFPADLDSDSAAVGRSRAVFK